MFLSAKTTIGIERPRCPTDNVLSIACGMHFFRFSHSSLPSFPSGCYVDGFLDTFVCLFVLNILLLEKCGLDAVEHILADHNRS